MSEQDNTHEHDDDAGSEALDLLAMQGDSLEGAAVEPMQQAQAERAAAQVQTVAAELLSILELARMAAAPAFADWWPAYGQKVWTDEQLQAIAHHGAAVMERHGWTLGDAMSKWGPHIALIGATAPPAFATYKAIQWHKQQAAQAAAPRPAPAHQGAANDGWHGPRNADGSPAP